MYADSLQDDLDAESLEVPIRLLLVVVVSYLTYYLIVCPRLLTQMRQHAFNRLAPGATRLFSPFPRRPGQLYHTNCVLMINPVHSLVAQK